MQLRKATRTKAKIRLGLSAVSGGGKTYSAILIAKGLAGGNLEKVAIIDTENGSADLYEHLGDYQVLPLTAPYTPERYIQAIKTCEAAGMEVIIIDSITHEWEGEGGILEQSSNMAGNSYTNWAKLTPRHDAFKNAMLQSPCHIITTVRRKQDYELTDINGKKVPQKVGLKEVTREGWEYELTLNIELDIKHNATASKDRTGLFMGKPSFVPSEETGELIRHWCENGVPLDPFQMRYGTVAEVGNVLDEVNDLKKLANLYYVNAEMIEATPILKQSFSDKKHEITGTKPTPEPTAQQEQKKAIKQPKNASNVQKHIDAINACKTQVELNTLFKANEEEIKANADVMGLFMQRDTEFETSK